MEGYIIEFDLLNFFISLQLISYLLVCKLFFSFLLHNKDGFLLFSNFTLILVDLLFMINRLGIFSICFLLTTQTLFSFLFLNILLLLADNSFVTKK